MVGKKLGWLPLSMLLLVACNLGQGVPQGEVTPTADVVIPAEIPTVDVQSGTTLTATPGTENTLAATMGPVTVTGDLTVGSTLSILVRRGDAVSSVNCQTVQQGTNAVEVLDPPTTSGPSLDGTFSETFSFAPEQAGTYTASCTAVALTAEGLQEVDADSSPFSIEAKG